MTNEYEIVSRLIPDEPSPMKGISMHMSPGKWGGSATAPCWEFDPSTLKTAEDVIEFARWFFAYRSDLYDSYVLSFTGEQAPEAFKGYERFFKKREPENFSAWYQENLAHNAPHFSARELLVKGENHNSEHRPGYQLNTDPPKELWGNCVELVMTLEYMRSLLGDMPVHLLSVYRSPEYNAVVGGAENSRHMRFDAADIWVEGRSPREVHSTLLEIRNGEFFSGGLGLYKNYVHVDTRGVNADWGML